MVGVDQGYLEALLGQELEEGEVVGARGLQGHPGGAVVGQGGQEGLAAFRGVGEAKSGGLGGGGDQGQVQVGLADVNLDLRGAEDPR
jgi:hypothetical protein